MEGRGDADLAPDRPNSGQPDPKRAKLGDARFVLVSGFDEPDKPVEADLKLLEESGCRLALLVGNSEPASYSSGRPVYHAGNTLTRAMLVTFLKSLALGELVLSKNVSVGEALKVFEYEGIALSGSKSKVAVPSDGVAFSKRDESALTSVAALCESVADAIVRWPRLEHVLALVLSDNGRSTSSSSSQFTATATRAWIRFAERPAAVSGDGDHILALATANPPWLVSGLLYIGVTHHRMSSEEPGFGARRDEESFGRLWQQVEAEPLGNFACVLLDACKSMRDDASRHEVARGFAFAREVREGVINEKSVNKQYCRMLVRYVEYTRTHTPTCARLFSGLCSDDSGSTPERTALKKALKARGVGVVKWSDERDPNVKPLVFPPSWRDKAASLGPSVLLSFENVV